MYAMPLKWFSCPHLPGPREWQELVGANAAKLVWYNTRSRVPKDNINCAELNELVQLEDFRRTAHVRLLGLEGYTSKISSTKIFDSPSASSLFILSAWSFFSRLFAYIRCWIHFKAENWWPTCMSKISSSKAVGLLLDNALEPANFVLCVRE